MSDFATLCTEAQRGAELAPVQTLAPEALDLLAETFIDTDLIAAREAQDQAQQAVTAHDPALAAARAAAMEAVDDSARFLIADAEGRRAEVMHCRLEQAALLASKNVEAAEHDADRKKFQWIQDFQRRAAEITTAQETEFLKKAKPQLLAIAQKARALAIFQRDVRDATTAEFQRLSAILAAQK